MSRVLILGFLISLTCTCAPGLLASNPNDVNFSLHLTRDTQLVDMTLNNPGDQMRILYINQHAPQAPSALQQLVAGTVVVQETDGRREPDR